MEAKTQPKIPVINYNKLFIQWVKKQTKASGRVWCDNYIKYLEENPQISLPMLPSTSKRAAIVLSAHINREDAITLAKDALEAYIVDLNVKKGMLV